MPKVSNADYWRIAQELRPVRLRRAVRLAQPHEVQQLLAQLQGHEQDAGLRGVVADAMDEAGREHEGRALRSADPVQVWLTHGANPELRLRRGDTRRGAWLDADTPEGARDGLLAALSRHANIHISKGDPRTGEDKLEEHANHGHLYVPQPWYGSEPPPNDRGGLMIQYGRSTLSYMPVYGSRIVRIRVHSPGASHHGGILYQHPTYHHGKIEIRPYTKWGRLAPGYEHREPKWEVAVDGNGHAGFNTQLGARRWVRKMGLELG